MMFMNEWEIDSQVERQRDHPVLSRATRALAEWRDVVNQNSDGWAYWKGGTSAARQLMQLIQRGDGTEAELRRALAPVKATCTRRNLPFETVEAAAKDISF